MPLRISGSEVSDRSHGKSFQLREFPEDAHPVRDGVARVAEVGVDLRPEVRIADVVGQAQPAKLGKLAVARSLGRQPGIQVSNVTTIPA